MSDAASSELPEMLEAERVVFLVIVGLSLVGLLFGATASEASDLDGAGFVPRPRVRVGVSSWWELLRCDERAGAFLERGMRESQRHGDSTLCRVEIDDAHVSTKCFPWTIPGRRSARIGRKPAKGKETQSLHAGKLNETSSHSKRRCADRRRRQPEGIKDRKKGKME